jgi:hypothetical protein
MRRDFSGCRRLPRYVQLEAVPGTENALSEGEIKQDSGDKQQLRDYLSPRQLSSVKADHFVRRRSEARKYYDS